MVVSLSYYILTLGCLGCLTGIAADFAVIPHVCFSLGCYGCYFGLFYTYSWLLLLLFWITIYLLWVIWVVLAGTAANFVVILHVAMMLFAWLLWLLFWFTILTLGCFCCFVGLYTYSGLLGLFSRHRNWFCSKTPYRQGSWCLVTMVIIFGYYIATLDCYGCYFGCYVLTLGCYCCFFGLYTYSGLFGLF